MMEIYFSVDVEAAGPTPSRYSMLSVGACIVGDADKTFYTELEPINNNFVPDAMTIAGHDLAYFAGHGVPPSVAMKNFNKWVLTTAGVYNPVFVGFNAPFDWSFVNWYFNEYFGSNPFGIGGIDIKAYFMAISGCLWSETTASKIPKRFKGKSPHTHNALDDAIQQAEMFEKMLAYTNDRNNLS